MRQSPCDQAKALFNGLSECSIGYWLHVRLALSPMAYCGGRAAEEEDVLKIFFDEKQQSS